MFSFFFIFSVENFFEKNRYLGIFFFVKNTKKTADLWTADLSEEALHTISIEFHLVRLIVQYSTSTRDVAPSPDMIYRYRVIFN